MNNIEEYFKEMKLSYIDKNDTFNFHCVQCGKCCMDRDDIILNPFDIYNISKELNMSNIDFINKYCSIILGTGSKLPIVTLNPKENGHCPFLKFDVKDGAVYRCSINDFKPSVCRNHPIGIVRDNKNSSYKFVHTMHCNDSLEDESHVVSDWAKFYIDHEEEFNYANKLQIKIFEIINLRKFVHLNEFLKANNPDHSKDELFLSFLSLCMSIISKIVYCEYDSSKPFIEQTELKMQELEKALTPLKKIYTKMEELANKISMEVYNKSFDEFIEED